MKDLQLGEIEEIELQPVKDYPNIWKDQLKAAVNRDGKETSFDNRVKIKDVIDVWGVK